MMTTLTLDQTQLEMVHIALTHYIERVLPKGYDPGGMRTRQPWIDLHEMVRILYNLSPLQERKQ